MLRRTIIIIVGFAPLALHAQDLSVGHCECVCKITVPNKCISALTTADCSQDCDSYCGAGITDTLKTRSQPYDGACPFHCGKGSYQTLVQHIRSTISHLGADLWHGPNNDDLLTGEHARAILKSTAMNSSQKDYDQYGQAVCEINAALLVDIDKALKEAIPQCKQEFDRTIQEDFNWVAINKQQWFDLKKVIDEGNINYARGIFSDHESHDDHRRNSIYCYNGTEIRALLSKIPGHPPTSPPDNKIRHDPEGHPSKFN